MLLQRVILCPLVRLLICLGTGMLYPVNTETAALRLEVLRTVRFAKGIKDSKGSQGRARR